MMPTPATPTAAAVRVPSRVVGTALATWALSGEAIVPNPRALLLRVRFFTNLLQILYTSIALLNVT